MNELPTKVLLLIFEHDLMRYIAYIATMKLFYNALKFVRNTARRDRIETQALSHMDRRN